MKTWPDYYCAERTLDIELPWGGLTARVWFDSKSTEWSDDKLVQLAQSVRRNEAWRNQHPSKLLDWLADLPAVNAVQVFRAFVGGRIGVMAYTVVFDEAENFQVQFTGEEMDRMVEEIQRRIQEQGSPIQLLGRQD